MKVSSPLVVYLPDTRGVQISPFGMGNTKIGFPVFTYSRLPGSPGVIPIGALRSGIALLDEGTAKSGYQGTCPGSTAECREICYAARPVAEQGVVHDVWERNSRTSDVPELPAEAQLLRIHISGDFDSVEYIENWIRRLTERPDVTAWAYTKSWRVPELLPALERLRALPNLQLFASMDASGRDYPPAGWRRAWIYRDTPHANGWQVEDRLSPLPGVVYSKQAGLNYTHTAYGPNWEPTPSYVCPEETGYKKDCRSCGYCFEGRKNDVTFLEH